MFRTDNAFRVPLYSSTITPCVGTYSVTSNRFTCMFELDCLLIELKRFPHDVRSSKHVLIKNGNNVLYISVMYSVPSQSGTLVPFLQTRRSIGSKDVIARLLQRQHKCNIMVQFQKRRSLLLCHSHIHQRAHVGENGVQLNWKPIKITPYIIVRQSRVRMSTFKTNYWYRCPLIYTELPVFCDPNRAACNICSWKFSESVFKEGNFR